MGWIKYLLDLFYPPRCRSCRGLLSGEEIICRRCQGKRLSRVEPRGGGLPSSPGSPAAALASRRGDACPGARYRGDLPRDIFSPPGDLAREGPPPGEYDPPRDTAVAGPRACQEGHTGETRYYLAGISALGEYRGDLKDMVYLLKYRGQREMAEALAPPLARHLSGYFSRGEWQFPGGVVPVPLHPRRLESRGFNQAEELAGALGRQLGLPVINCLERVKDTRSQTRLSRQERFLNVRGAFRLAESFPGNYPPSLLLVDDVYTTGATLNECAGALHREAGVKAIYGAVVCHNRGEKAESITKRQERSSTE